jgi:hypothetical protein
MAVEVQVLMCSQKAFILNRKTRLTIFSNFPWKCIMMFYRYWESIYFNYLTLSLARQDQPGKIIWPILLSTLFLDTSFYSTLSRFAIDKFDSCQLWHFLEDLVNFIWLEWSVRLFVASMNVDRVKITRSGQVIFSVYS